MFCRIIQLKLRFISEHRKNETKKKRKKKKTEKHTLKFHAQKLKCDLEFSEVTNESSSIFRFAIHNPFISFEKKICMNVFITVMIYYEYMLFIITALALCTRFY